MRVLGGRLCAERRRAGFRGEASDTKWSVEADTQKAHQKCISHCVYNQLYFTGPDVITGSHKRFPTHNKNNSNATADPQFTLMNQFEF